MPSPEVTIVSVGMMTSVGLSAVETAASVRAGTMRFTETSWRDQRFQPFVVSEVLEGGLPELTEATAQQVGLTYREARLLRLGAGALVGCLKPIADRLKQPGLALALPEAETTALLDPAQILRLLGQQTGQVFDIGQAAAKWRGRAGGLLAIGHASQAIREGQTKFMLAGGMDTYRDLFVLGILDTEKRIKSDANLDGFIPGEGACFLLLANREAAEQAGLKSLAAISPTAEASETGHFYSNDVYKGEGLAEAFQSLFSLDSGKQPIQEVYSSMNGESHWGKEWGVAFLRNRSAFAPSYDMHHPADCFGDTGAACGPLMAGLAALGMAQGYRKSPCLVYGSGDRGQRAAVTLSHPNTN